MGIAGTGWFPPSQRGRAWQPRGQAGGELWFGGKGDSELPWEAVLATPHSLHLLRATESATSPRSWGGLQCGWPAGQGERMQASAKFSPL